MRQHLPLPCWLALSCVLGVLPINLAAWESAQEKARVEFRWLASKHVQGLTSPKKLQTTCGGGYRYAHIKPVLTHIDVANAYMDNIDYPTLGILFRVTFDLTPEAKEKLTKSCSTDDCRLLGAFIDGEYCGARCFRRKEAAKCQPSAGFRKSKTWAIRIVNACKKPDA